MKSILLLPFLFSCSLFGIQDEEGPRYKVIEKFSDFEIREYESYIVAKTTVQGDYDGSSSKAFRILAGYIFGKNKGEKKIAMTSPVEMKAEPKKIAMTAPVEMKTQGESLTMTFSMPSKYNINTLPEPLDKRIRFEKVPVKTVACYRFSGRTSQKTIQKMQAKLKAWLKKRDNYQTIGEYSYAGYNPPWTLPFMRRNEVMVEIQPR
jgi:hypothetical protein